MLWLMLLVVLVLPTTVYAEEKAAKESPGAGATDRFRKIGNDAGDEISKAASRIGREVDRVLQKNREESKRRQTKP